MKVALALIATLCLIQFASPQELNVLLDNEWVKVSKIKDRPGSKRARHSHKDTLVIALTDHGTRVKAVKPAKFDIRAGQVVWFADVTHSEENIGKTNGELLLVEVKKP